MSDYGALAKVAEIIAAPLRIKQVPEANLRGADTSSGRDRARLNYWMAGCLLKRSLMKVASIDQSADLSVCDIALEHPETAVWMDIFDPLRA